MKKRISFLFLCLFLLCAISIPAFAAPFAEISPQALRVNGKIVNCMKYNIDGFNYIRLRDLAMILKGTDSEFAIEYDVNQKLTHLIPNAKYVPDGSELQILGDQSGTAVEMATELLIDGDRVSSIGNYKIGNDLFFRLRDLAPFLSLSIEYDDLRNMVLLSTLSAKEERYPVLEITQDENGSITEIINRSYDKNGFLSSVVIERASGTTTYDYSYSADGLKTGEIAKAGGKETVTAYEYDAYGNLATERVTLPSGDTYQIDRSYDDLGRILQEKCAGSADDYVMTSTYDDAHNTVSSICSFLSGASQSNDMTLDVAGNVIAETIKYVAASYQSVEEIQRTFDAYGNILSEFSTFSDSEGFSSNNGFSYTRNSAGNPISCTYSNGDVTNFNLKTTQELSISSDSVAGRVLSGNSENDENAGRLESVIHHISYLPIILKSNSDSIKYLNNIAASRMTDEAGELRYIYTNRLFGCKSSFTFFQNGMPTMTGHSDLYDRVRNGKYSFSQDIAGLEALWLTGSELQKISFEQANEVFNVEWTDNEWKNVQSLCPAPELYYLFVYGRGEDGVLRVQYLIPNALNVSYDCQTFCLTSENEFGMPAGSQISAELEIGSIVLK